MRRWTLSATILVAALSAGASACVDRLVAFQVRRVTSMQVVRIQGDRFTMRIRCEVANPNRVGARLSGIRFRTYSGEHLLGTGEVPGTVDAPARGSLTLAPLMSVRYDSLPADFPERVKGGELQLTTRVAFRASSKLGALDLRLHSSDRLAVKSIVEVAVRGSFQGPNIKVARIQPRGIDLRRTHLVVDLRARNPFAFPVGVRRGAFVLFVDGRRVGDASLDQRLVVQPGAWSRIRTTLVADHGALGSALLSLLGQDPRFRVKGTLWIDPIGGVSKLPIDVTADASVLDE